MRDFLSLIIMPVPILFLLLIIAFGFYISKRARTTKAYLMIAGIWFLIISTLPIPKALDRLTESIRIHKMIPGTRLILSGNISNTELSPSLVLYRAALLLGIDSVSMAMQELPSNTQMEAEEYAKNFGKENALIVFTSDIHMPRAMMLFRKAGHNPIAAPTNQILKYGSHKKTWRWVPSSENIGMMEAAIHEYA
jgi:hypothetical protein